MSTIFVFAFAVYQSIMRALGKVSLPMYIILFTVILNFFMDPLFIFTFGLGTVGAAWATILSEVINTLIALWLILKGRSEIVLERKNFTPNWKELKKILKVGIPGSMEQFFRSAGLVLITFLVTGFGVSSIAAYGVGGEVLGLVMIISLSFMMSTSIMVGRSVGAGRLERAEAITRALAKISFFVLTILGIFLFFFAENVSRLFIPNDLEVIKQSAEYIRIISLFFGFFGLQQVFNAAFTGAGDTITSMVLSIFSFWILRIPVAYILSHHTSLGFFGVGWSFSITCVIAALLGYLVFRFGKWKERRIKH
jgi:putative MATE family efflux protein